MTKSNQELIPDAGKVTLGKILMMGKYDVTKMTVPILTRSCVFLRSC